MTIYWRLQDIPELHGVPSQRRGRLWREARARCFTPRRLWMALGVRFVAPLAVSGLCWLLLPAVSPWWPGLLALTVSGVVYDTTVHTSAARCWLREHAYELDRYVPA